MSDKAPHVTVDVQLTTNTNGAGLARHFGPIVKASTQKATTCVTGEQSSRR